MRFYSIWILILSIDYGVCLAQNLGSIKDYLLIAEDSGILVEEFDSTNTDENRYNHDNVIYKVGNSFKYSFRHITSGDERKYFKVDERKEDWDFVDAQNTDSTTIRSVLIEVANGNPMAKYVPDYNQTALIYKIGSSKKTSMSGAIENEGNVWIHPPRDYYFRILELNPFPYIKAPYEIGSKWTWYLRIGDHWADARWKIWHGSIENDYEYEITDKINFKTDFGTFDCFVIKSKATSRIGQTGLIAYFSPKYGFVKLEYDNIDGSKTILELVEHVEEEEGG